MVALPWIGAILTMTLWVLGRFGISWGVGDLPLMLTGLIFMDGVHIIFTFAMMLSLPELKKWAASEGARAPSGLLKHKRPWTQFILVGAFLGVLFYILKVSPNTHTIRGMATTWLFLELVGPAQHTVAQMRGISFCYNGALRRKFQFTDAEKAVAMRCEKVERFLFNTLLLGEVAYWIPNIFGLDKIAVSGVESVSYLGGIVSVASVAGLIVNALYFPRQEESRKVAFIFRVILFPLKMLTTIGGIFLRAAHGTEYLMIFRRMVKGSSLEKAQRNRVFLATTIVCSVYALVFMMTWPFALNQLTGFTESDVLLGYAMLGAFILRFTHYYMDRTLYRMSNPNTRAAVAPLLITPFPSEKFAKEAAIGIATPLPARA